MKIWFVRFNTYLLLVLLGLMTGCRSTKNERDKERSALQLHLEVIPDGTERNKPVPIFREKPVLINVDQSPFIDERDIAQAKLLDEMGGFSIQLQLNWHGTMMLGNITSTNPGRRIAIRTQFGKPVQTRWLAAPVVGRRITNGILTFTPDASRDEAEQIVRGLNNMVAKIKKRNKF